MSFREGAEVRRVSPAGCRVMPSSVRVFVLPPARTVRGAYGSGLTGVNGSVPARCTR